MDNAIYRRTVRLYWVRDKSRGYEYYKPLIKFTLPQDVLNIYGAGKGDRILFDMEIKPDGSIVLYPLALERGSG